MLGGALRLRLNRLGSQPWRAEVSESSLRSAGIRLRRGEHGLTSVRGSTLSGGEHPGYPLAPTPDITYVMLHSLAHLLITAMALDRGYNTSSLRERIYVTPQGGEF